MIQDIVAELAKKSGWSRIQTIGDDGPLFPIPGSLRELKVFYELAKQQGREERDKEARAQEPHHYLCRGSTVFSDDPCPECVPYYAATMPAAVVPDGHYRKALEAIATSDVRITRKADQCTHGQYGYEHCENCIAEYAQAALDAAPAQPAVPEARHANDCLWHCEFQSQVEGGKPVHGKCTCGATRAQPAPDDVRRDAERYRWLRERNLDTINTGGVFAGKTPDNLVLNGNDLDTAIDAAIAQEGK